MPNSSRQPDSAAELLRLHNVLRRSLESCIDHAASLAEGEAKGVDSRAFVAYVETFLDMFVAHHSTEEEVVFPVLAERDPDGPFASYHHDHDSLERHARRIREICAVVGEIGDSLAFEKLLVVLVELQGELLPHLEAEEEYCTQAWYDAHFTAQEQLELGRAASAHGQKHGGPGYRSLPFLIHNMSPEERSGFEDRLPFFLTKLMIPFVWRLRWRDMDPFLAYP